MHIADCAKSHVAYNSIGISMTPNLSNRGIHMIRLPTILLINCWSGISTEEKSVVIVGTSVQLSHWAELPDVSQRVD